MGATMTADEIKRRDEAEALFVSDDELRRRIDPKIGRDRFKAIVKQLDTQGFPSKHPIFGGRYWPKVLQWLDKDNGVDVAKNEIIDHAEDGVENFDAAPRRKAKRQERRR
jgi:hypothetical protein